MGFFLVGEATPTTEAHIAPEVIPEPAPVVEIHREPLPVDVEGLLDEYSTLYGVSREIMMRTLYCESRLKFDAVGDGGHSFGIAQIHLPSHPEITKADALDPDFAIRFMAQEFEKGNAWKWTCWRIISSQ